MVPDPMPWLAVDGGQGEIRLRLADGSEAAAQGVRHRPGGPVPGILAAIDDGLERLGQPRVQVAALGMSGLVQEPGPVGELGRGVIAATGARRVLISGDDLTWHAGALRGKPGVMAAIGTGTTVLGMRPSGTFTSVDGRGYLLGDDGSAFRLGQAGLRAVLEHAEGLHPRTALTEAAITRYGPLASIAHDIYRSPAPVPAVAAFAQDVLAAARQGDRTATDLAGSAMDALARSIRAAATGFEAAQVPVVVVGGLWRGSDVLAPLLVRALEQILPTAHLQEAAGTALDGAAWLAMHDAGPYASRMHVVSRPARQRPEAGT